jgi:hypothetical protein
MSDDARFELQMQHFWKSNPDSKDIEVFEDGREFRLALRSARQAYAQRWNEGTGKDGNLLKRDFGFRVQDIRTCLFGCSMGSNTLITRPVMASRLLHG